MTEGIPWEGDERQRLLFGLLENGVPVLAVSAGYNWSFVKNHIARDENGAPLFFDLNIPNTGTQFRSRDIYPHALKRIIDRDESILGDRIDPAKIPDYPKNQVVYVDGYKNIKFSTAAAEFDPELRSVPELAVTLNGITRNARNALSGSVENEGLILRPGSSGIESDPFLELQLIGGFARELFESPGQPFVYVDNHNLITFEQ